MSFTEKDIPGAINPNPAQGKEQTFTDQYIWRVDSPVLFHPALFFSKEGAERHAKTCGGNIRHYQLID